MHHFIVEFSVVIDGALPIVGTIGSVSMTTDYQPNLVKGTIVEQMKKDYPKNNHFAVVIISANEVPEKQYYEASKGFIELTN